ncbi:MAG: magnesium/cobalt transporter CorA [Candidatus Caldarchaeales archaeon]
MENGTLENLMDTEIRLIEYDEDSFKEEVLKKVDECKPLINMQKFRWIQVVGLKDRESIMRLAENFKIHELTLEDILRLDQRAKIEEFYDYTYIVLRMFNYGPEEELFSKQLSIVLSSDTVITFQEEASEILDNIKDQIKFSRGIVRKMYVDYLIYLMMDSVVDSYFYILEKIEEYIQNIEDELTSNPSSRILQSIHKLKRDLIQMQKNLWPLREVVGRLERATYRFIREQTIPYFRDLYDHVVTVIENVEMLHITLSDMLDIYFSAVSTKLNEIMKILTMIATIFMPLTFIAGIYGMNFKYMPELEMIWGYPAVLMVMSGVGLWMVFYFRRKRWI